MKSYPYYLSFILIFCLITKNAQASDQKLIQVSPEEMEELLNDQNIKTKVVPLEEGQDAKTEVKEHLNGSRSNFLPIGNGQGVLVVFAIVGAVLIIAWIVSFPYALYKAIKHRKAPPDQIIGLSYHVLNLNEAHNSNKSYSSRTGGLLGLKYSFYLGDFVGLTTEIGHFTFKDKSFLGNSQNHAHGQYWSVGPSIKYILKMPHNRILLKMDLGAGSSFNSQFGLMSKVEISANLLFDPNFFIGAGIGGMYLKINKFDGVTRTSQDTGLGLVLKSGYVF